MAFAGWFSRWSPEGHYLAAGDSTITVAQVSVVGGVVQLTNEITVGAGIAPAWITNTPRTLFWWNRASALMHAQEAAFFPLVLVNGIQTQGHLGASGYGYDAGGGKWITFIAGDGLRVSDGTHIPSGRVPAMDQNGRYVYQIGDLQLVVSGVGVVHSAAIGIINPHISTQGVTWGEFVSPSRRETYGWRGGGVERVHASANTEFWSIPIDTPHGPWILSDDSVQLYLRPWGGTSLRIVGPGDTFFPHAVYSTIHGGFLVSWSDAAGNLATAFVESDATGVVPGTPGSGGPGTPPPLSSDPVPSLIVPRRPPPVTITPRAIYPHVEEIQDLKAQQSVRLLWDKVHQMTERLERGDIAERLTGLSAGLAATNTRLDNQQSELAGDPSAGLATSLPGGTPGAPPPPGGGGEPPPPPSGGGGCSDSPGSGHFDPGGPITEERARKIVCGTGDEWSALRVATPTLADRETNAETLLRRCIWHLDQGGFVAGRQRNPSTAISKDKLTIVIGTETRAFDIFSSYDAHQVVMAMAWSEVFPADAVADAGIPD